MLACLSKNYDLFYRSSCSQLHNLFGMLGNHNYSFLITHYSLLFASSTEGGIEADHRLHLVEVVGDFR